MRAFDFLQQPGVALMQALLLKFQPNFMDVLPLYIVLLLALPPVLWLMLRQPTLTLLLSVALYAAVQRFRLEPARLSDRDLVLQSARLAAYLHLPARGARSAAAST